MNKVLFSGIQNAIALNLSKATHNVSVAVAWLTNPILFGILLERQRTGVPVILILADDRVNFFSQQIDIQSFLDAGGEVRISKFPNLMHHKFCVIDEKIVITGSYNWTQSAEHRNLENIIISIDGNLVRGFLTGFTSLVEHTEEVTDITALTFHDYNYPSEGEGLLAPNDLLGSRKREKVSNTSEGPVAATGIPQDYLEQFKRADQYYRQKKHAPALKILEVLEKALPHSAEVFDLISCVKWRQKKYKEQVQYAEKAIQLKPDFWEAYNMAAIGYARLGNDSKAINYYRICIQNEPEDFVFLKNRGESYLNLHYDDNIPIARKKQFRFAENAVSNLKETIRVTTQQESLESTYMLYYTRASAKYSLYGFEDFNRIKLAKGDFLKAKQLYESAPSEERDAHIYDEIKASLKDIERAL